MEEITSANMQEVAETAEAVEEVTQESVEETPQESEETVEVAEQPQRDFEKDAAFAQMRRAEQNAKKEAELLKAALKRFDLKGNTAHELADEAEAYISGRNINDVRTEREQNERLQAILDENKALRERESQRLLRDDLEAIKKIDPECKANSVTDLGEEFIKMRAYGIDTETAYQVLKTKQASKIVEKPKSMGSVKTTAKTEKDFYSSEDVDNLSDKDLDDPKIFAKVMRSMTKW